LYRAAAEPFVIGSVITFNLKLLCGGLGAGSSLSKSGEIANTCPRGLIRFAHETTSMGGDPA
jgi:hypothetical protein